MGQKDSILRSQIIRGSSNGRTEDSESSNLGSSPSPRAKRKQQPTLLFLYACHRFGQSTL